MFVSVLIGSLFFNFLVLPLLALLTHHPNAMIYNDENYTESFAQILTSVIKQIVEYNMIYEEYIKVEDEFEHSEEA